MQRSPILLVVLLALLLGLGSNPSQAQGHDDHDHHDHEHEHEEEEEHYHALLGPIDKLIFLLSKPAADDMVINIVTFDEPCDEHMFENATSSQGHGHLHVGDTAMGGAEYELATHGAIAEGSETDVWPFYVDLVGKACTLVVLPKWPVSANGLMLLNATSLKPPKITFLDASEPHDNHTTSAPTTSAASRASVSSIGLLVAMVVALAGGSA